MTTTARKELADRGLALNVYANRKLYESFNVGKGDDWNEYDLYFLVARLDREVTEFRHEAYLAESELDEFGRIPKARQGSLKEEAGDIINFLRFICSKYGAI